MPLKKGNERAMPIAVNPRPANWIGTGTGAPSTLRSGKSANLHLATCLVRRFHRMGRAPIMPTDMAKAAQRTD